MGVDALFRAEYPRLAAALSVAFGEDAAADALQEAFAAADVRWRRVGRLDDPAGWVRRVALNRLLNGRRNETRRAEILESVTLLGVVDDRDVDAHLDLRSALSALPERMRAAVVLHYLADLAVDDVAGAMGISSGTVKSTLHDARARLRDALEEPRHV